MSLRWPLVALEVGAGAHCPCGHSGPSRAVRWARVWSALAALEKGEEIVCEVFSQDRVQQRLVNQMVEVRKGPVEQFFEFPAPQMVEQLEEVPEIFVEVAVSSGEAGSFLARRDKYSPHHQHSSRRACW